MLCVLARLSSQDTQAQIDQSEAGKQHCQHCKSASSFFYLKQMNVVARDVAMNDSLGVQVRQRAQNVSSKVQVRIQGDQLRVTSKDKDTLQAVIKALRDAEDGRGMTDYASVDEMFKDLGL